MVGGEKRKRDDDDMFESTSIPNINTTPYKKDNKSKQNNDISPDNDDNKKQMKLSPKRKTKKIKLGVNNGNQGTTEKIYIDSAPTIIDPEDILQYQELSNNQTYSLLNNILTADYPRKSEISLQNHLYCFHPLLPVFMMVEALYKMYNEIKEEYYNQQKELDNNSDIYDKNKLCSFIVSNKNWTSGHKFRLDILQKY